MSLIRLQRSLGIVVLLISTLFEINAQVCSDESACNYAPFDGPGYCLQIEPYAVHSGFVGSTDLTGYTTYRVYALCESADDFVSSVSGDADFPTTVVSDGDVFQSDLGGALGSDINNSLMSFFPSLAFDSFVTIGLTEGATSTEGTINSLNSDSNPWQFNFENDGNVIIDDQVGGSWFIFNGETNGIAGEDFRVLLAQITTTGTLSGSMYVQFFEEGSVENELRVFIDFSSACVGPDDTTDCTYPDAGVDCDGNCLVDTDGDGVCDSQEIPGCTDSEACNYSMDATDEDASCTYALAGYDCDGVCNFDMDNDGICDEFESPGCLDSSACNYDAGASEDDGSCSYPEFGFNCSGSCIDDIDGDGICDSFEVEGCTDSEAANFNPFATDNDGTCVDPVCIDEEACNFTEFNEVGFCLIIEPYMEHSGMVGSVDLTDHVTYRIYARCENPSDFVTSVSGDSEFPTRIISTEPMVQSALGGLTGSDQNSVLFGFFPDAEFDSYVTIGLTEGPAAGEGPINTTDSPNNPWGENFELGNDLLIDDEIGGGWYILNGQSNGVAGDDLRVLLAQVTTSGTLSGSFYVQVFVEGSPANEVRALIDLNAACVAPGGIDVCEFPAFGTDCDGNCLEDSDGDGVCDPFEIEGCQDFIACNYNADATDEDGSCNYADEGYDCNGNCLADADADGICDSFEIAGCTESLACNYNGLATDDDASCFFAETAYDCENNCINDADGDGVCDEFEVVGCMDSMACNYDAGATDESGACAYPDYGYDCNGECLGDVDFDGICDANEIAGCTDIEATNFDPFATDENGTCEDPLCVDEVACNYTEFDDSGYCIVIEPVQVHTGFVGDDDLTGQVTYRIYARCENPTDFVSSVSGDNLFPTRIQSTEPFYQSGVGGVLGDDQNPLLFGFFPSAEFDSYVTVGLTESPVAGEGAINYVESDLNPWADNFEAGSDLNIDDSVGGGWFIFNGQSNGVAGDDQRVLLAQVTTAGVLTGSMYVQFFINGSISNEVREFIDFDNACISPGGPEACEFPEAGYDCEGNCIDDVDNDGVCDEFEIDGCMDVMACNYSMEATDEDGSCVYADSGYDCLGNCLQDADNDGICDEFEISGCQDAAAANYDPIATDDDGSCVDPDCIDEDACNFVDFDWNGFCLTIEPYQIHDGIVGDDNLEGQVTYRIYARCENPTDFVTSVSGDSEFPTRIQSTEPFFQSPFGGLLSNDQTPSLFGFFPSAEFDSFLTIGLTESASSGEGNINVSGATGNPWGSNFESGSDLIIDDAVGGGWFIFNGQTNGIAGDDQKVLLAQVTTAGVLTGSMYVQFFANGDIGDEVRELLDFENACVTPGGPEACEFPEFGYDCDGNCLADADGDGVCDPFEIVGCQDDVACNYDADATDAGDCVYSDGITDCDGNCLNDADGDFVCDENEISGCLNPNACNYVDPSIVTDLETCVFAASGYDCDGNCLVDTDGDGVCDEFEIEGCLDTLACNYDADTTDEVDCIYEVDGYDCDGVCLNDVDGDGTCDEFEISGCTDAAACNYDASHTEEDGSCDFCSCGAPASGYSLIVEEHAVDGIAGTTTYRFYVGMENADDVLSAMYGNPLSPMVLTTADGFYNSASVTGATADGVNPAFFAFFPSMAYDSWVTIGTDQQAVGAQIPASAVESDLQPWINAFVAGSDLDGQNITIDDWVGGAWYILNGAPNGVADAENQRVLMMQLTTSGGFSGMMNAQIFPNGVGAEEILKSFTFDGPGVYNANGESSNGQGNACGCTDPSASNYDEGAEYENGDCLYPGCTDEVACNYDATATIDDTSCTYADAGYDCAGTCLIDTDEDGVCDQFEIGGCQDDTACNFNAGATDEDGSCVYEVDGYDCDGNCVADADEDGICDQFEVAGCQDDTACNYDAEATDSDGSCEYAVDGYDCDGNCLIDTDEDGICDQFEVGGCQDETACDFNADATDEDGSCTYAATGYDCDGNCLADADGDGVCDGFEITGCIYNHASNYNMMATDDDGSCLFGGCLDEDYVNYNPYANASDDNCSSAPISADFNGDGVVQNQDLLDFLLAYGQSGPVWGGVDWIQNACNIVSTPLEDLYTAVDYCEGMNAPVACEDMGCTYPMASNYDAAATVDAGDCVWTGCTDSDALNYNTVANLDDDSCNYSVCPDFNGDGEVQAQDLLDFLLAWGTTY